MQTQLMFQVQKGTFIRLKTGVSMCQRPYITALRIKNKLNKQTNGLFPLETNRNTLNVMLRGNAVC